ncbi:MAG TPA: rod shape-determining protein MreC [Ignavibacteriales bacterium]|nr:rod shape-determining protein MreC [Ignavibacteriales bacterium]HPD66486.1 rod shape-determining protein MreC [Ignavibacteriales bacterium]HRR19267.1 rod shape-determining protein MreC [Ignavibacteriales bacterium]HRT99435.1 rod shape-determining protein MreC [Ignavibacteriales bacterium]
MLEKITLFIYKYKNFLIFALLFNLSLVLISHSSNEFFGLRTYVFSAFAYFNNLIVSSENYFNLISENQKLREINAKLLLENTRLRAAANNSLKYEKLLKIQDTSNFPLISASILTKYYKPYSINFVIDKGLVDSVAVGMPVMNEEGLLGIVKSVSRNHSLVSSIFNIDMKITIRNSRNNLDGILSYDGNSLTIINATNLFDMQYGDMIYTSDFSSLFPPKIPVGYIQKPNNDKSTDIRVKPAANIYETDKVFVIKFIKNLYLSNYNQ